MKIGEFVSSAGSKRFDIEDVTSKIFIKVKFNAPTLATLGATPRKQAGALIGYFGAVCGTGNISISKHSANGGKFHFVDEIKLSDIAELCANGEGNVHIYSLSHTDANNVIYYAEFSIDLSSIGAVKLSQNDKIRVDFKGFGLYDNGGGGGVVTDANWYVSQVGYYSSTDVLQKYEQINVFTGTPKTIRVENYTHIAVPHTTSVLRMTSFQQNTMELDNAEIRMLASDAGDMVYNVNGTFIQTNAWRVISIAQIQTLTVSLPADGNVWLIGPADGTIDK